MAIRHATTRSKPYRSTQSPRRVVKTKPLKPHEPRFRATRPGPAERSAILAFGVYRIGVRTLPDNFSCQHEKLSGVSLTVDEEKRQECTSYERSNSLTSYYNAMKIVVISRVYSVYAYSYSGTQSINGTIIFRNYKKDPPIFSKHNYIMIGVNLNDFSTKLTVTSRLQRNLITNNHLLNTKMALDAPGKL